MRGIKIVVPLGLLLVLSLTGCDRGESYQSMEEEFDSGVNGRTVESPNGATVAPDTAMELDPMNPILPLEPDTTGDMVTESGFGAYVEGMSVQTALLPEEVEPVASWGEMVAHSKYRATSRGWVYDPLGSDYDGSDLWKDAQMSIDEAGRDIQRAMRDFGHETPKSSEK